MLWDSSPVLRACHVLRFARVRWASSRTPLVLSLNLTMSCDEGAARDLLDSPDIVIASAHGSQSIHQQEPDMKSKQTKAAQ